MHNLHEVELLDYEKLANIVSIVSTAIGKHTQIILIHLITGLEKLIVGSSNRIKKSKARCCFASPAKPPNLPLQQ